MSDCGLASWLNRLAHRSPDILTQHFRQMGESPCLPRPPRMQPSERLRVADDTIDADIGDDDWQQVPVGTHGGIAE